MPITVFFCYARKDKALLDDLKAHLRPLQRQGLIELWDDGDISAGTEWEKEISQHLNTAQIILLLVSPGFMNSDYAYSIEMNRAVERHERQEACVIPVILRPVYWQVDPLNRLQALPTGGKPVTSDSWYSLDDALFNVTEGIRNVVEQLESLPFSVEKLAVFHPLTGAIERGDGQTLSLPVPKHLSKAEQLMTSIRDGKSNQESLVKRYMQEIVETIEKEPLIFDQNDRDQWQDILLEAIDDLHSRVLEFTKLADCIVQEGIGSVAHALYSGFDGIRNLYTLPPPARTTYIPRPEQDLAKFLGYELFVILFALLIKHEKWDLIGNLLDEELYARAHDFDQSPQLIPFYDLNQAISAMSLNSRNSFHPSPQADILAEKYIQNGLLKYLTMEEFVDADFFLYLRALVNPEELIDPTKWRWLPRCWSLLSRPPVYLQRAQRVKYANHLVTAMGVKDIPMLKLRLQERTRHTTEVLSRGYIDYRMAGFDYSTIGIR